ncbi:MAG TPA: hypothetical protein VK524_34905 [Polyangiaceae bacterium]|nr:hypothetical protein [Polyangiaceae bacterium]
MTVQTLVDKIAAARGPFFVARLGLRLQFLIEREANSQREEHLQAIVEVCSELGFDAAPLLRETFRPSQGF